MPKHDRNLLSSRSVAAFAQYATTMGAQVRPGKGQFQLLQVKTSGPDWHAICTNTLDVVTTPPSLRTLIQQFKAAKLPVEVMIGINDPVRCPPAKPVDKSADQYVADLRDDSALELMSALVIRSGALINGELPDMSDEAIMKNARLAYRMADALLIAGGHRE